MRIWKYQLTINDWSLQRSFSLAIPKDCEFLTVSPQRGTPCLWVEVDPESPKVTWNFTWVPTGGEAPEIGIYVGTVFFESGDLVFHLYDLGHDDDATTPE